MMHPYQLHSLSKVYRDEALQEAQTRHLVYRAKAPRRLRSEQQQGLWSWLGKLGAAVGPS
jgi:hypothetical protein